MVADLVAGIAKHQNDLLAAFSDSSKTDSESVSGKDRENYTYSLSAQFVSYVCSELLCGGVVLFGTSQDGFCDSKHVFSADFKFSVVDTVHKGIYYDLS